jgi:GNAT superfamily N-acetyltransferase
MAFMLNSLRSLSIFCHFLGWGRWCRRGLLIANASYIVHHEHRGIGIGYALGRESLRVAAAKGFKAMQFNYVVSTNAKAVALWQSLGFVIIGTMPAGYRHSRHGLVDVYMMHRFLDEARA